MSKFREALLHKNGKVILTLAGIPDPLSRERIDTVAGYAQRFRRPGHCPIRPPNFCKRWGRWCWKPVGTWAFLISLDYKVLWEAADFGTIMAVMPLPYSARYEGLATGLFKAFEEAGFPSVWPLCGEPPGASTPSWQANTLAVMSKLAANLELQKEYR